MKTTMKLFSYALLVFALVFTSCSKDGEVGPIGPEGVDGVNGIDGTDGNANVTSVILRDISLSSNSTNTFVVSQLTQEILDKGLVIVDINLNPSAGYELWSPLPVVLFDKTVKVAQIREGEIDIHNASIPLVGHLKVILVEGN